MDTPVISVIVVNYNGRHLLAECLDSLGLQNFRDFEVIVVDNASTDGSVDFLAENYPRVKVVENKTNRGFGGGNNDGMARAGGQYLAFLNNDATVGPGWLAALARAAGRHPEAGMFASKILNYYNPSEIDNVGLIIYRDGLARGRGRLETDRGQYGQEEEVILPSGCACLFRKAMLEEIGGFDEELFLYMDDVDIGLRGRLAGWRCVYVPEAVVYHKYSATAEPFSPLKAFLLERNRIWVVLKYFPLAMCGASLFYTALRYAMQVYGALTGRGAGSRLVRSGSLWQTAGIICRAYVAALRGAGAMLRQRKALRTHRKISAAQFSAYFKRFGIGVREIALKE